MLPPFKYTGLTGASLLPPYASLCTTLYIYRHHGSSYSSYSYPTSILLAIPGRPVWKDSGKRRTMGGEYNDAHARQATDALGLSTSKVALG